MCAKLSYKFVPVFGVVGLVNSCNEVGKQVVDCEDINRKFISFTRCSCMSYTLVAFYSRFLQVLVTWREWESSIYNRSFISSRNRCFSFQIFLVGFSASKSLDIGRKGAGRDFSVGDSVWNEVFSILSGLLVQICEFKNGVLKARVYTITKRIAFEKIVAPSYIDREFGQICEAECANRQNNSEVYEWVFTHKSTIK